MSQYQNLDRRSREVFQRLVENYLRTGDPVGSRNLSLELSENISPATVRNVMSDLELMGLLGAPHTSAGRMPTEIGLRFFVDGILEMQNISETDQAMIEQSIRGMNSQEDTGSDMLERTGSMLSQISKTASLVFSKKQDTRLKHIDFVMLSNNQALVVLVGEDGQVDNRVFEPPKGITRSDMVRAANFINTHVSGKTVGEFRQTIEKAMLEQSQQVDDMMRQLVELGKASIVEDDQGGRLIVRGRSNLIDAHQDEETLEQLRVLMDDLERKRDLSELLQLTDAAQAVCVFIGSENKLFSLKGSSLVISPYMNGEGKIIGALGVVGPTRLNYARIVPMVSYTAGIIGKMIEEES